MSQEQEYIDIFEQNLTLIKEPCAELLNEAREKARLSHLLKGTERMTTGQRVCMHIKFYLHFYLLRIYIIIYYQGTESFIFDNSTLNTQQIIAYFGHRNILFHLYNHLLYI